MPPTYNLQLDRLAVDRDGAKAKVDTDCANAAVLKLVVLGVGRPAKEQTNKTYVLSQQTQGNGHNTRYLKAYHKSEQEAALSNARVANQDELVHEITGSTREQKRATRGNQHWFLFSVSVTVKLLWAGANHGQSLANALIYRKMKKHAQSSTHLRSTY
jgi:hypothetical protein